MTHTGVQALRVDVFTSLVQWTLESVRHTQKVYKPYKFMCLQASSSGL